MALADVDPSTPDVWTYDNADAIRQRAQQAFQAVADTMRPFIASGDFAGAQRVLTASPPPNQPPPVDPASKAIGDALRAQWGAPGNVGNATPQEPVTPSTPPATVGNATPQQPPQSAYSLPGGDNLTAGTPAQQAPPVTPANGDVGLAQARAAGGDGDWLDAVKAGVARVLGNTADLAHQGLTFAVSGNIGQPQPGDAAYDDPFNTSAIPQGVLDKIPAVPLGPVGDTRSLIAGATSPVSVALAGTGALTNPATESAIEALGGGALATIGVHAGEGAAINTGLTAADQLLAGQGLDKDSLIRSAEGGAILGGALPAVTNLPGAAREIGSGYRSLLGPEGSLSTAAQSIVPGMGGSIINDASPDADAYVSALDRHGIDFHYDPDGNIVVDDPAAAESVVQNLTGRALQNLEGTATPGGTGMRNTVLFGTQAWEDMMRERAGKPGAPPRTLPGGDASDIANMDDAERIGEVLSPDPPPANAEATRATIPADATLADHPPLPPDERATLETQAKNRTKGNVKAANAASATLGQDDADRFVDQLAGTGTNIRGMQVLIDSQIDQRGFTVGRTNLSLREAAFRTHLTEISNELADKGLAAFHTGGSGTEETPAGEVPAGRFGNAAAEVRTEAAPDAGTPAAPGVAAANGSPQAEVTVKRPDLFGGVHDTFQTEAELNGFRATQGGFAMPDAPAPQPGANVAGESATPLAAPPVTGAHTDALTPQVQARRLIAAAAQQSSAFLADARQAAQSAGADLIARAHDHAVKGFARTAQKLAEGRTVTDVLRTTVLSDDPLASADSIRTGMKARGYDVAEPEDRWTDKTPLNGYGDVTLKLRKDGVASEIQILPQWMLDAKTSAGGHDVFAQSRVLPAGPERDALEAQQAAHYSEAERRALSARNLADQASPLATSSRQNASLSGAADSLDSNESGRSSPGLPGTHGGRDSLDSIATNRGETTPSSVAQGGYQPPADGPRTTMGAGGVPREVPARGSGANMAAIAAKAEALKQPGPIFDKLPPVFRKGVALLNPAVGQDQQALVAWRARGALESSLNSEFAAGMAPYVKDVENALADHPPEYIGKPGTPAQAKLIGTFKDIADRPGQYVIDPVLRKALNAYDNATWAKVSARARADANVDVQPYNPQQNPDFVFTPTVASKASLDAKLADAGPRTVGGTSSSRGIKTRVYDSAWDRVGRNPTFEPETDVRELTNIHNRAMASNAGNETLKLGAGGKTRVDILDELHPGLRDAKIQAQQGLATLKGMLDTATRNQGDVIRQYMKQTTVANLADDRTAPLQARINELGNDYGPELSYLSGQVHELQLQKSAIQAAQKAMGPRVVAAGERVNGLLDAVNTAQTRVGELVKAYQSAGTDPYVLDPNTHQYFTPEGAKTMGDLLSTPRGGAAGIMKAVDFVRSSVLAGHMTPLTINGTLGFFQDPVMAAKTAFGITKDMLTVHDSPTTQLTRIAQAEPEMVQRYTTAMGREFAPALSPEFTPTGLYAKIPVLHSMQEQMYAAVQQLTYNAWKSDTAFLQKWNPEMSQNLADHESANLVQKSMAAMNMGETRGVSPLRGGVERSVAISPSFVLGPAGLVKDATSGLAKLAKATTVDPATAWRQLDGREQLAVLRAANIAGTLATISAVTAVLSAPSRNMTPQAALKEAFDPTSKFFSAFQYGNGNSVPIGGPIRSLVKAFAPLMQGDGFGAINSGLSYLNGKLNPGIKLPLDEIRNADWKGDPIRNGSVGNNLVHSLWYAAESVLPIAAQETSSSLRTGQGFDRQTLYKTLGTLGGENLSPSSPTERLNQIARGKGYSSFYGDTPRSVQQQIEQQNPELWKEYLAGASTQTQQYNQAKDSFLTRQQSRDDALLSGQITAKDYKSQSDNEKQQLIGREAQIYQDSGQKAPKTAADRYYATIDQNTDPNTGVTNWAAVNTWFAQQPVADQNYIDANTGLTKTPLGKLKLALSKQYYALPKYYGLTPAQGDAVDSVLQQVGTGTQAVRLRALNALPDLGQVDPQTVQWARRAIMGTLNVRRDRANWVKAHPESAIFFNGGGKLTPAQQDAIKAALAAQK